MPRDATATKQRLLLAAERRFALDGVRAAKLSDIVRDAGQANDAAVHYHFGGRSGLLWAILAEHVELMERSRRPLGEGWSDVELVATMLEPAANALHTERGRLFLRIAAQLAASYSSGVRTFGLHTYLDGTVLHQHMVALGQRVPEGVEAERRVTMVLLFGATSMADRAHRIDAGEPCEDHGDYLAELAGMLAAAAVAPIPDVGQRLSPATTPGAAAPR